jgi:hypothetical protein
VTDPWAAPSDPFAAPPSSAETRPRRRRTIVLLTLGVVLGLAVMAFGALRVVQKGTTMRTEGQRYLDHLNVGDTGAAYRLWCPEDQAKLSQAEFTAQQQYRAGEHGQVVDGVWPIRINQVNYRTEQGSGQLRLALVHHRYWSICPHGNELPAANSASMTPEQRLESDIAREVRTRKLAPPLGSVNCPTLSRLVDGKAIACTATSVLGDGFTVIATESSHASKTEVSITPASAGPG